jgi:hypothetical protein
MADERLTQEQKEALAEAVIVRSSEMGKIEKGQGQRKRLTVSLPRTLVAQFVYLAVLEGKTRSQKFEELVWPYLEKELGLTRG